MNRILGTGDQFPSLTFTLVSGDKVRIPDDVPTSYAILLFYRSNWCRHCMRQLAEYEGMKVELEHLSASIYAVSTDPLEEARKTVDRGLTFPVAYGLTRRDVDRIGARWNENRTPHVEPAEFVVEQNGTVFGSLYGSGGNFGITPEQAVFMVLRRERSHRASKRSAGVVGAG